MSNYTKATNFATKDALNTGDPAKIVSGSEIDTEFNAIASASSTKSDLASPTFTGTLTAVTITGTGVATVDSLVVTGAATADSLVVTGAITAAAATFDGGTY